MEKIKFRARSGENGEWEYFDFTKPHEVRKLSERIERGWIIGLGQFTGLKDKNGKEIFKKDCLGGIWGSTYIGWCEKQGGWELINCEKECMACLGDVHWYEVVEDKNLEVIGNIYDNPELLK